MTRATGTSAGPYELLELIGEGGMGAVYRGRDPRFDRPVAVKLLHPQLQRSQDVVERFKAEAVIQAKLNHPNIVSVLDFVADEQHLAIVMECVDGQPLDTLIEQAAGPLPVERTVRLMDQVLSAMGYAHKRGLVHRDIKPSNILVQSIEGQEYAKVMDFGIAKILGSEKVRTATGAKMGTLAYMSPEHVRSPREVDTRSDVYSLGVVLYEMLTGQVPFDADSEYELMRRIVEEEPRDVLSLAGSLPRGLSAVVETALAKDPANRFPSCDAMRQALLDATASSPAAAERGGRASATTGSGQLDRIEQGIGRALFDAVEKVGLDGAIRIVLDDAHTGPARAEVFEGCRFESSCWLPLDVANGARDEVPLRDPFVLLIGGCVRRSERLGSMTRDLAGRGASLLVVATDMDGDALEWFESARSEGTVPCAAVAPRGTPHAVLEDLAVLTGGLVVPEDLRPRGRYVPIPRDLRLNDLGRARAVAVGPASTTLVDSAGPVAGLDSHVRKLRRAIDESTSDGAREGLQERLARVVGGVAEVRIGVGGGGDGNPRREVEEFLEQLATGPELLRRLWATLGHRIPEGRVERSWRNIFHAKKGTRHPLEIRR